MVLEYYALLGRDDGVEKIIKKNGVNIKNCF